MSTTETSEYRSTIGSPEVCDVYSDAHNVQWAWDGQAWHKVEWCNQDIPSQLRIEPECPSTDIRTLRRFGAQLDPTGFQQRRADGFLKNAVELCNELQQTTAQQLAQSSTPQVQYSLSKPWYGLGLLPERKVTTTCDYLIPKYIEQRGYLEPSQRVHALAWQPATRQYAPEDLVYFRTVGSSGSQIQFHDARGKVVTLPQSVCGTDKYFVYTARKSV